MGTNASLGDAVAGNATYGAHEANRLRNLAMRGNLSQRFSYVEDFANYNDEDWTVTGGGAGTPAPTDATATLVGGWLGIPTGSSDNDETYVAAKAKSFFINTTDKMYFETRVTNTANASGATGDASFVVGLASVFANDLLVDTPGTFITTADAIVFVLEENANVAFVTSNNTTQTRTASAYAWTDADTVTLGFLVLPNDGVTAKCVPIVNGVAGTAHDLTISGLAAMRILLGVKAHAGYVQTLNVDWVLGCQEIDR